MEKDSQDMLYEEAKETVLKAGKISASYLQRKLRVSYSRASRLIDELEANGVVGPSNGAKPRKILNQPNDSQEWEKEFDEKFLNKDMNDSTSQFNEQVRGKLPSLFKAFIKEEKKRSLIEGMEIAKGVTKLELDSTDCKHKECLEFGFCLIYQKAIGDAKCFFDSKIKELNK